MADGFPDAPVPDTSALTALAEAAAGCRACDLFERATGTVFGSGPRRARLMLVGEQPGDVEDRQGEPFVGPSGAELERALDDAGLDRKSIYVTNAVKHFSFTERGKQRIHKTPRAHHIRACRPWLVSEVRSIAPEILVCLGGVAAKSVLGPRTRVFRDRGVIVERDSLIGPGRFLVTVHPSSILRTPGDQRAQAHRDFVADLQVIADALG